MELHYEGFFLETAVFLCARRGDPPVPSAQVYRFHWEREQVYREPDPEIRERRFSEVHLAWFREWGLERRWRRVLEEDPLIVAKLDRLVVCRPRGRGEAGIELYVDSDRRTSAVLALFPEMLVTGVGLEAFLRHEFLHLHDMLDPAFAYKPVLQLFGLPPGCEPLVRDRYRLLWDISVDGRLHRAGLPAPGSVRQYEEAFCRRFARWPEEQRWEVFRRLWSGLPVGHEELARWAADPQALNPLIGPIPGGPCPLCGFPTFDWAASETVLAVECLVRRDFPAWEPHLGFCGRCAELYQARSKSAGRPVAA